MPGDLHQRLLDATSPLTAAEERTPEELAATIRAVVERHAPALCNFGNCLSPSHRVCSACGSGINHPCPELLLIARELHIPLPTPEKENPTDG